jgi:hypothetical protein
MAPQIGPKDAAIILKNPIRLSATPLMARMALIVTPTIVDTGRETLGSIVLKLFAAIKAEKQVGTRQAAAKRKNITGARAPTLAMAAV